MRVVRAAAAAVTVAALLVVVGALPAAATNDWTPVTTPSGYKIVGPLSCVSADVCMAVAQTTPYADALNVIGTTNGSTWSAGATSLPGSFARVPLLSCSTADDCWVIGNTIGGGHTIASTTDFGTGLDVGQCHLPGWQLELLRARVCRTDDHVLRSGRGHFCTVRSR